MRLALKRSLVVFGVLLASIVEVTQGKRDASTTTASAHQVAPVWQTKAQPVHHEDVHAAFLEPAKPQRSTAPVCETPVVQAAEAHW